MRNVWHLAMKDLRLLMRDRVGFFFTFFFPLVYAVFFGMIFSGMADEGPSEIRILVVDADQTDASRAFIERLETLETLKVETVESLATARGVVADGQRAAYVSIAAGFETASQRAFWGDPMQVELGYDPGQGMTAGLLEGLITAQLFEQFGSRLNDPDAMRNSVQTALESIGGANDMSPTDRLLLTTLLNDVDAFYDARESPATQAATQPAAMGTPGWQPIKVDSHPVERPGAGGIRVSSFAICFPQGILWGVLACAATFATSLLIERTGGTLPRLLASPLTPSHILAGKALACLLTTVVLIVFMLIVAAVVFDVRPTSVPLLAVSTVMVAIGILGLMMVFSTLGTTEAAVSGISWAVIVVMAMIGGAMVPLMFMPAWLKPLTHFSIVTWAIRALEGPLWRGSGIENLLLPWAVLLAIGVGGFALGSTVYRRRVLS